MSRSISDQITWRYTEDLQRSGDFYRNVLGLQLIRDEGAARIYRVREGSGIGICLAFDDRVVEPAGSMISLVTEDVDGWFEYLKRHNVTLKGPPHRLEKFGIYTFFAEDPDGYVIEFQSFID